MPNAKLSKAVVEAAAPQDRRHTLWDSSLPGFGLRVEPTGAKSYIVKYRAEGGGRAAPQRFVGIGRHPAVKFPEAKAQAERLLARVALGQDPAFELEERRREFRVGDLLDLYEAEGLVVQRGVRQGEPMKPLTAQYTMARLRSHVAPLIGRKRLSEITETDVERLARDIAKGKTARDEVEGPRRRIIVRGGEGAARKVVRDLSAVFSFGVRRRLLPSNPVAHASVRKTDNRRTRFLSVAEVRRLGEALSGLVAEGVNRKAVDIARLWALTGCRRNEIAGLKWSEFDEDRGLLLLEESKTGKSVRPLGSAAFALLSALKAERAGASPYVFPAERGQGFYQGTKKVWPEAVRRAGLEDVSPHTLRHTVGGAAASGGEALLMIGAILGHSNARSTAIYAHVAHDPARMAADKATGAIAEALGPARA